MQSFDEAEVSELVGKYFLDILKIEFAGKKKVGLYRDHGLSCFENMSRPELVWKRYGKVLKIMVWESQLKLIYISQTTQM